MALRLLISLSLLLLSRQALRAQTADDFFHGGAQHYLSNRLAEARQQVDAGLKLYPDDTKLKKLDELLNQPPQEQPSEADQQPRENQQDQQSQQEQAKQDQPQQSEQNQDQTEQDQTQPDQQKPDSKSSAGEAQDPSAPQPQAESPDMAAHAMTAQEAKQLLDAQKDNEQVLIFRPSEPPKNRERPFKDW